MAPSRLLSAPFVLALACSGCGPETDGASGADSANANATGGNAGSVGGSSGGGFGGGSSGGPPGGSGGTGGQPAVVPGAGGTGGAGGAGGLGGGDSDIVPLFDDTTALEPEVVEDTPAALVTRLADRGRDRHARESQFQAYEHYLPLYWEHRTVQIEIVDTVGRGGDEVTFNVTTGWKLSARDLRTFYMGESGVAQYRDNRGMTPIDDLHYTHVVERNATEGRELRVGDKMELELSQFLDNPPRGRENYYGTAFLYVVGTGIVPWAGTGEGRDSEPIPESAWLGGHTTVHQNESDEPDNALIQMAHNLAPANGQRFVLGRRVLHTAFDDGTHDESAENPAWTELAGLLGPGYVNRSCDGCHTKNGRALPAAPGEVLDRYVMKVGDAQGRPDPDVGAVLQTASSGGAPEGSVRLAEWTEQDGLRRPTYVFDGATPAAYSARISPQLVGIGLLEAIPEDAVLALADPEDADGDGISGRAHVVTDPVTFEPRLGRFGWKAAQAAVRHQVAAAFRTDMGVLTSVFPSPDCGSRQGDCGADGAELPDAQLDDLTAYVALLGVRPQRAWGAPDVVRGRELFGTVGCAGCHAPSFETSPYHPHAELRRQTIQPYTDLLLHDMGAGLADTLPEGDASGAEWRTAPLWSLGLGPGVSGGESYLHDGRARTLTEAVLWHGGEGERARDAFSALPDADREALLAFLRSL